jgi:iron complex transport system ATP-binding protein
MNLLIFDDIHFSYQRPVLAGVSLVVRAGELLALLGTNGAGKSTLLQLGSGALTPQRGKVLLANEDLASLSRRNVAKRLALVAQASDMRFPLTALEYVLTGRFAYGSAMGFDAPENVASAMAALRDTDAEQFAERRFNATSPPSSSHTNSTSPPNSPTT